MTSVVVEVVVSTWDVVRGDVVAKLVPVVDVIPVLLLVVVLLVLTL